MRGEGKTKDQLINEAVEMCQQIAKLEALEARHKRAEEALRQGEERFHKIFEHSNDAIFVVDPERDEILDVNTKAGNMLGYSQEELLSMSMSAVHPNEMPELMAFARSVFKKGQGWTDELTCRTSKGEFLFAEISASVIEIANRPCMISLVRNITDRKKMEEKLRQTRDELELRVEERTAELSKANEVLREQIGERVRAEEALRKSEERYRSMYNNTPIMLHSIDPNGQLVSVSDYWLESMGYEPNEVIGRKSTDFLSEASRRYAKEVTLPEFFKTGFAKNVPYQFVKKNGEIIDVLLSAISERDEEGKVIRTLAVLIDVTDRKRLEQELVQSEKLAATGRLAAGVAHEINNPLSIMKASLQIMKNQLGDDQLKEEVEALDEEVDRIARIVRGLLNFSRPDKGEIKSISLAQIFHGELFNIVKKQLLKENIRLNVELSPELPQFESSEDGLRQVFMNLIRNAEDAMPDGGDLTIGARSEGEYIRISVVDTGNGIPENEIEHIFDPFFSTKRGKGTGLGLSVSYGIVKGLGGTMDVRSEVGKGSTFIITLPFEEWYRV